MRTIAKSRTLLFWDMITPLSYRIGSYLYSISNFQIMDLDNGQSVCFAVRNRFRYFKIDFHRGYKRSREAAYRKHLSVGFLLFTHPGRMRLDYSSPSLICVSNLRWKTHLRSASGSIFPVVPTSSKPASRQYSLSLSFPLLSSSRCVSL